MAKKYSTIGQGFFNDCRAGRLGGQADLFSFLERKRHDDLLDRLSELRDLSMSAADPDARNVLEAIYHLSVAWVRSWDAGQPAGRADDLGRQLRSLCLAVEGRGANADVSNDRGERQGAGRALTRLILSLLDQVAENGPDRSRAFAPSVDRPDVMEGGEDLHAADRGEPARSLEGRACCPGSDCAMSVYVFGPFRVCIDGEFVGDWRSAKSQLVFKYLVVHRRCAIAKERLMDLFWPRIDPESARNNLNVAIHNIRQALQTEGRKLQSIIYRNGQYSLCSDLDVWTDFEAFVRIVDRAEKHAGDGDAEQEVAALTALDELYVGDFLEEDRYEAWVIPLRQQFQDMYKAALGKRAAFHLERWRYDRCIDIDKKIGRIDACDEQSHRRLMTCYARLGQNQLAMRQFNICVEALARELDIAPDGATVDLHERIRRREEV